MNLKLRQLLRETFSQGKLKTFQKREVIVGSGIKREGIFYIEKGYIKVYGIAKNGDQKIYLFYAPGEIFSMLWSSNLEEESVYYEALGEVEVKQVLQEQFFEAVQQDKRILGEFIKQVKVVTSALMQRIDQLSVGKADLRLATSLVDLAERVGSRATSGGVMLAKEISLTDLAAAVNMTRETASRELGKLKAKGLVTSKGNRIVITDVNKLKNS